MAPAARHPPAHPDQDQLRDPARDGDVARADHLGPPGRRYGDDVAQETQAGVPVGQFVPRIVPGENVLCRRARPPRSCQRDGHRAVEADDQGVAEQTEGQQPGATDAPVAGQKGRDEGGRDRETGRIDRAADDRPHDLRGDREVDQAPGMKRESAETLETAAGQDAEKDRREQCDHSDDHLVSVPCVFDTVLVADRGQVARRVIATCQRLGIKAVGVHSEVDAKAAHAAEADESVLLGPAPPDQSYRDALKVVEAARQTGAQAVHPGHGFLAHDAAFARAVLEAGLGWVGAPPEVLERCGASIGSPGAPERLLAVQLLGLADGRVLALCEQERSRAGLTESPAPGLAPHLRARLLDAAVSAGAAVGLRGVGTAEFAVVGDDLEFVGLDARLQLSYAVAELVTGLDLVEQQLLVAAQEDPSYDVLGRVDGCVVGLELRAEDPAGRRSAGVLTRWREPEGPGVRVDAGYRERDEVPADYAPLLGTLAVWAPERAEAVARARAALREFAVEGVVTNMGRFAQLLGDPTFLEGGTA